MSQNATTNPLLIGNRLPGVTFQLPSQGLFYFNDELDDTSVNGEVHVFPMTSYDEIMIKSPDLLLNGTAYSTIITRCVPQIKKPMELLSKDVDFIMTALRSVSFGDEVEINATHSCKDAKDHSYIINIGNFTTLAKRIDPTTRSQQYTCTLSDGKLVYLNPIKYDSLMKLLNLDHESADNQELSVEFIHNSMMDQLAGLISKVIIPARTNGNIEPIEISDKVYITEWVKTLPVGDIKIINSKIDNTTEWGSDLTYEVKCKDCNEPITVTVPLNPMRFFI